MQLSEYFKRDLWLTIHVITEWADTKIAKMPESYYKLQTNRAFYSGMFSGPADCVEYSYLLQFRNQPTCCISSISLHYRVPPGHGKSWNLGRPFSRPGKSWKIAKSWKMMITSWNFYYCTEQFCKSDTTSFIMSNYEPFYLFNNGNTSRWNCHY